MLKLAVPATSALRELSRPVGSARTSGDAASIAAVTGTLIRNTQRQPRPAVTAPPSNSPAVAPIPPIADQAASAVRCSAWPLKVCRIRDRAAGMSRAPAVPCPARAAMSTAAPGARPEARDVASKRASPVRNIRLGPSRSASQPPTSRMAPAGTVAATTIHCSPAADRCSACAIAGEAAKMLVAPITSTRNDIHSRPSVARPPAVLSRPAGLPAADGSTTSPCSQESRR
jgi:hypothetical protein